MVLVLVVVEQGVLRRDRNDRGREAPDLAEVRTRRERPERGRGGRRDERNGLVLGHGVSVVGANALAEDERQTVENVAGVVPVPVAAMMEGSAWRRSHSMVWPSDFRAYDRHANAPSTAVDFAVTVLGRRFLNGQRRCLRGGGGGGGGGASLVRVGDCVCVVSGDAVDGSVGVGHDGWNWIRACLVAAREKKKNKNKGFWFGELKERVMIEPETGGGGD
ncbi:hypothetical protein V8G54_002002 [Vigna mungo]|uniref:Uncharacterized protein n=1 Tax=Vigna mungo TaxID=3915 RepID=A0AAQ3P8G5_VIGMU